MLVVLPLFPAQPMLGPIYVQIDHLMPTDFPLLLVVPALRCIDIAMRRVRGHDWRAGARRRRVVRARVRRGQWPFADLLMTPVDAQLVIRQPPEHAVSASMPRSQRALVHARTRLTTSASAFPIAIAVAFVSARCGLWWGSWMARVQR